MGSRFLQFSLIFSFIFIQPVFAFWGKSNSKEFHKELSLANRSNIDKKFKAADGSVYRLKIEILIPHPENGDITVSTFYDEASDRSIEDIAWIVSSSPKKPEKKIQKFSSREEINKVYEQLTIEQNPGLAYDRLSQEKHIINKFFYFHKNDIISKKFNAKKPDENFLEISFGTNTNEKKRIALNKYIYQTTEYRVVDLPVKKSKPPKEKKFKKVKPTKETQHNFDTMGNSSTNIRQPLNPPPAAPAIKPNQAAPTTPTMNPALNPASNLNPYLNPEMSDTARELQDAKSTLDEFSKQVYPQNYEPANLNPDAGMEAPSDNSLEQMQKLLDDEYYGEEEEDEEYE